MFSPGQVDKILRALNSANLYAYQEHNETGKDVLESDDNEDGHLAEELQDDTIYFNDEDVHNNNNTAIESAKTTEDGTDSTDDQFHFHPFVDIKQCMKKRNHLTIPEPIGVGVLDWSLQRRLRLGCVPGRCLPQTSLPSSSSSDEGYFCINLLPV
jgi:hypothetical protein